MRLRFACMFVIVAACWTAKSSPTTVATNEPISNTTPHDAASASGSATSSPTSGGTTSGGTTSGGTATLRVTGIDPPRGDTNGGTYVVISGERFLVDGPRNVKVYFGSRQGTVVRFASDTQLIVQAPGGKPNERVDVLLVFDPGGQMKLPGAFTFVDAQPQP